MVGVIISGIIAGTAVISLVGFTRMLGDDTSRTTLKTFSVGMESFYTDKDRYPLSMTELADGKYVPQAYKAIPITDFCYVPAAGTQPQSYVATAKAATTGNLFSIVPDATDPSSVTDYPDTAAGSTPCKK
jgi:type II secretory pathway pseudopilin PulG